jgi:hypothetical protein
MSDQRNDGLGDYVRQVRESTQRYAKSLLSENEKLLALATSLHAEKLRLEDDIAKAEFARRENEELRRTIESLSSERVRLTTQVVSLRDQIVRHREIHSGLMDQLAHMEASNRTFAQQFVEVEQANSNLANLYVASYRLHGSLERDQVLSTIQEIVINLVGSEQFAVFERKADSTQLTVVSWFGVAPATYAAVDLASGRIGACVARGETYTAAPGDEPLAPCDEGLTACVPLKVDERVIGAIAIFRLLAHKSQLEAHDHELFTLLATHAASALYCADLHERLRVGERAA